MLHLNIDRRHPPPVWCWGRFWSSSSPLRTHKTGSNLGSCIDRGTRKEIHAVHVVIRFLRGWTVRGGETARKRTPPTGKLSAAIPKLTSRRRATILCSRHHVIATGR